MADLSPSADASHTTRALIHMHNLYIVGAGGYGRVVLSQLMSDAECGIHWQIRGFLDERKTLLEKFNIPFAIVGDPFTYIPKDGDIFIAALGAPEHRRHFAAPLLEKGGKFMNVLTEVQTSSNLRLGQGIFFERNVRVGPECTIGDFVTLHSMSILGHDIKIGDYSQISSFVFLGGGVQIGEEVTIYPHACILPGVKIGNKSIIGAGSVVIRDVPAGVTMFGNPAKRLAGQVTMGSGD